MMIKANELRVGNVISERDNHRFYKCISILEDGVRVKYWSCGETEIISFNKCMPIPLNSEILEKAGFERMQLATYKRWCKYHPTFYLQLSKGYYYVVGYKHYPNGIKYLHQLQNLYFALTGEELEIKM